MIKRLASMLIALAAMTGAMIPAASAASASSHRGIFVECDNPDQRSFLCLQRTGGKGAKVINQPAKNTSAQAFDAPFVTSCNGGAKVIISPVFCPFKNHALDREFRGSWIRQACFAEKGGCVGLSGTRLVNQPKSGGTGTTWITAGATWVNRAASDKAGAARYMTATRAAGGQPYVGLFKTNLSQWEGRQFPQAAR